MRSTRIGMVVIGLALWLLAIAWPGWQLPIMLLGVALVMAAVFGLLTADLDADPGRDSRQAPR